MLEQAYINNAKPDKQARLAIVERVSLNEKEVQVRDHTYPDVEPRRASLRVASPVVPETQLLTGRHRFGSKTEDRTTAENRVRSRPRR